MDNTETKIVDGKLEVTKISSEITHISIDELVKERDSIQKEKDDYMESFDKRLAEKDFLIERAKLGGLLEDKML